MPLKILIVTQGVSRIVLPLFESRHNVVGVVESAPRGQVSGKFIAVVRYCLFTFAEVVFNVQQLSSYCKKRGVDYRLMRSNRDPGLISWIAGCNPDVIIVHSMSQLLKSDIYNIPRLGTINLHPSFLPDYRGPSPEFWQYHDLELNPGATVHFIDDGEDTGAIIFQDRIKISLGMKSPEVSQKLISDLGVSLILRALDKLESGNPEVLVQPVVSPTQRARNIRNDEHQNIIKWDEWKIDHIWHVLRGTEQWLDAIPRPGGLYKGQRWNIGGYELERTDKYEIGHIYRRDGVSILACRDGVIFLRAQFSLKLLAKNIVLFVLRRRSF